MASSQQPPPSPKPKHIFRGQSLKNAAVLERRPEAPTSRSLQHSIAELGNSAGDRLSAITTVDIEAPRQGHEKHAPMKPIQKPLPLHPRDRNRQPVSSSTYANKPVYSANPKSQQADRSASRAENATLKPQGLLKVRKLPRQGSPKLTGQDELDHVRPKLSVHRGQPLLKRRREQQGYYVDTRQHNHQPVRQQRNHKSRLQPLAAKCQVDSAYAASPAQPREAQRHTDQYRIDPVYSISRAEAYPVQSTDKKIRGHPACVRIPVRPPPPPPPLSAYVFTEHPLSLAFSHHTNKYLKELRAKHPRTLRAVYDHLVALQQDAKSKESKLLSDFATLTTQACKPLSAEPSSNGSGTVRDRLMHWRDEVKTVLTNYKTMNDSYERTLQSIRAFRRDIHEKRPEAGVHAQKVDDIRKSFDQERRTLLEAAKEEMIKVAKELEKGEKAAKAREQKIRRRTESMLRELLEDDEGEGEEGE